MGSIGVIMCEACNQCEKSTHRTDEEKKKLKKRLNVIEGQIRGISGMIDDDKYCHDILVQLSAVEHSLKSIGIEMLKSHLSSCVVRDLKEDHLEVIDEVMDLIRRLD